MNAQIDGQGPLWIKLFECDVCRAFLPTDLLLHSACNTIGSEHLCDCIPHSGMSLCGSILFASQQVVPKGIHGVAAAWAWAPWHI
jgi:hypothetical protein